MSKRKSPSSPQLPVPVELIERRIFSIRGHRVMLDRDQMEKKYDVQFKVVFDAIRKLMEPPPTPKRRIGFRLRDEDQQQ